MKNPLFLWLALLLATTAFSSGQLNFSTKTLGGISVNNPTSIDLGPDGRVYLSTQSGTLYAYTVVRDPGGDYAAVSTETINIIRTIPNHDDDGTLNTSVSTRQVTGILVKGTSSNPVIYVSSSDPRIGGGSSRGDINLDTNSGTLSRLSWDGSEWLKVDLVRGLPRSEENHANNGMSLDEASNTLYLAVGGLTNAGSPSNNFTFISEYAYSACIVRIDLDALDALPVQIGGGTNYVYDLPTLDDPTRSNTGGQDTNDPFGGNDGLNMAKLTVGSPVQIFSAGFRNAYDVAITEAGRIYTWDNGPNSGWGGHPDNEGGGNVTNKYVTGEPGSTGAGPNDAQVNNRDGLHLVGSLSDTNRTYYGGHPNPIRANPSGAGLWTNSTNTASSGFWRQSQTGNTATTLPSDWPPVPPSLADTREGDFQNPGVDDGALWTVGSSTNGLVEYRSNSFGGALKGDLLAASFNGTIYRVDLNPQGTINSNSDVTTFASGFGTTPLDLTAQADDELFPGTIWAATYGSDSVTIFEPADAPTCTGIDSDTLDDDEDGFSNADEIDSGTNPCNAADRPFDADGDLISDLNDPDDDNDGRPDTSDFFPLDPLDGLGTTIPIDYELLNGDPGFGFYGLGFTGLMHDGTSDYLDLIADENNSSTEIIAGGAVGLFTINAQATGSSFGSDKTQKNGFQFGLNVMETTPPFTVRTSLVNPTLGSSTTRLGLFIGTGNQDDYVNISFRQAGFLAVRETAGVTTEQSLAVTNANDINEAILQLSVDPAAGTVQAAVSYDGGNLVDIGTPFDITGALLNALQNEPAVAIGVALQNPLGSTNQSGTWDSITVSYDNEAGCEGSWATLTTPAGSFDARHEADYVKVGGKFYLVGGRGDRSLSIYDPASESWTDGTKPPVQTHHFQGLAYQGELWIFGAFSGNYPDETPVTKAIIYNPATDSWRDGPDISRPRGGCGVAAYDGKIYMSCGITNGHIDGHVKWLDCYDPATGNWTQLPDAPTARDHFRSVVIGDRIYHAAGRRSMSNDNVFANTEASVDYFDISANQWFTVPASGNIPTQRAGNAALNYQGKLIIAGGESADQSSAHNEVEVFDPATEQWSSLPPMIEGRHGSGLVERNGDLYIASGSGGRGGGPELSTHEKYTGCTSADYQPTLVIDESNTFSQVTSGDTGTITVPLQNTSDQALSLGSVSTDDSRFVITNAIPNLISAGQTFTVQISFDPGSGGDETFSSILTIVTNIPGNPIRTVTLTGERYTAPVGPQVILALNAGGPTYTGGGITYEADSGASGGGTRNVSDAISGTTDDVLYQSERWSDATFSYSKTVPNGDYELTLKFAEIFAATDNPSSFDVSIEGTQVLDNLNLIAAAGRFVAYDRSFPVTIADGTLDLSVTRVDRYGKLSGFVLTSVPPPSTSSLAIVGTPPVAEAPIGGSAPLPVLVRNPSTLPVIISAITNEDPDFVTVTSVPLTVPPGTTVTLEINFAPTATGPVPDNGLMTITSDATETPTLTQNLQGIRVTETSLALVGTPPVGSAFAGEQDTIPVVISNPSDRAVTISSLSSNSSEFTPSTATPVTLAAGDSTILNITFAPTASGGANKSAILTIGSDATGTPFLAVDLAGTRQVVATLGIFEAAEDIGAVSATGSTTYDPNNAQYTLEGSGSDIWGTADEFQFTYRRLTGNGSITARVTGQTNPNAWSKAGVMIRGSLDAGTRHAICVVTPGNGVAFQRRLTPDGTSSHTGGSGSTAPRWVRLTREGDFFTASESADGSNWTVISSDTVNLPATAYFGLALTSHNDGTLAVATFDNVTLPQDTDGDLITDLSDPDDDNDLISDVMEAILGLDPTSTDSDGDGVSDFDEDSDHDGYTNGQEILTLGTDPSDGSSIFRLNFTGEQMSFPILAGNTYEVWTSSDLDNWTLHPNSPFIPTSGQTFTMSIDADRNDLYFRVKIFSAE